MESSRWEGAAVFSRRVTSRRQVSFISVLSSRDTCAEELLGLELWPPECRHSFHIRPGERLPRGRVIRPSVIRPPVLIPTASGDVPERSKVAEADWDSTDTRCWIYVGLTLVQRRGRWTNVKLTLSQHSINIKKTCKTKYEIWNRPIQKCIGRL